MIWKDYSSHFMLNPTTENGFLVFKSLLPPELLRPMKPLSVSGIQNSNSRRTLCLLILSREPETFQASLMHLKIWVAFQKLLKGFVVKFGRNSYPRPARQTTLSTLCDLPMLRNLGNLLLRKRSPSPLWKIPNSILAQQNPNCRPWLLPVLSWFKWENPSSQFQE